MIRFASLVLLLLSSTLGVLPGGNLAVNVVVSGIVALRPREYLSDLSGQYYLVMQPDCRLLLYNRSGQPLWSTELNNTAEAVIPDCYLTLEEDGNLVIYEIRVFQAFPPGGRVKYFSQLWQQDFVHHGVVDVTHWFLLLGTDGSVDFYDHNANRRVVQPSIRTDSVNASKTYPRFLPNSSEFKAWKPSQSLNNLYAPNNHPYMAAEYFLPEGSNLTTVNSRFKVELGSDCNLQTREVFYDKSEGPALWESGTNSSQNRKCELALQQNGLLVIRDVNTSEVYWNSTKTGSQDQNTVSWILKVNPDDGRLSVSDIKNPSNILWTNVLDVVPVPSPRPNKLAIVWIMVGVVGGVFVLAMAALGLYFCARERFLDPAEKAFQEQLRASGGNSQALTQAKIKQATNNYGHLIGRGGFGDVFYGKLPDGQEVAAKVLSENSHQSKQEFFNEIELLSMVHHKYLVSLVGYSCTRKHQILIYEYMGGGDLRQRLQGVVGNPLTWRQRTSIILQVAEGLEYLHDKCSPPIIHRDVKSTNILLTSKLVAKVADFGLSKLKTIGKEDATHITTVVKGTPGYLDPEYHETGMLTEKSDVYAFGIVLMEILTGQHHINIAQRVGEAWKLEQFDDMADPNLGEDFDREELVYLMELAFLCIRRGSAERPLMREVVRSLHDLDLTPFQPSQDMVELDKDDSHQVMATELVPLDSETISLNESSSNNKSFEVAKYPRTQVRSRTQLR